MMLTKACNIAKNRLINNINDGNKPNNVADIDETILNNLYN